MTVDFSVVIVAGGRGRRMGAVLPKQFWEADGKPVLFFTIEKFARTLSEVEIILVLPQHYISFWQEKIKTKNFEIKHKIVAGGKERFFSVKNALKYVTGKYTAIHDGVRPLVSDNVIKKGFELVQKYNAVVPAVKPVSSFRLLQDSKNISIDRELLREVQTPQFFETNLLKSAYNADFNKLFTDDASVVENAGYEIFLFEGNYENIKITRPLDFEIFKFYQKNNFI